MGFDDQSNQSAHLCDLCGERPASVDVMFVGAGGRQQHGAVCEPCARAVLAQQQGGALDGGLLGDRARGPFPGPGGGPALRQRAGTRQRSATPALDRFGRDLTAEARAGGIDPVIGREAEIEQVIEALTRRRKNNAALIGEAGVGKTAIARALGCGSPRVRCRRRFATCESSRSTSLG